MPRLKKKYMQPPTPTKPVSMMPALVVPEWPAYMDHHTAARYISETYWTIRNLVKAEELTAKKLGSRNTVSKVQVDAVWHQANTAA
jgi:hypothetical protein